MTISTSTRTGRSAILRGEIPYKDFSMESPPIIDYMMVPAQLLGGESYQYALYFSMFSIFTGISILRFPAAL